MLHTLSDSRLRRENKGTLSRVLARVRRAKASAEQHKAASKPASKPGTLTRSKKGRDTEAAPSSPNFSYSATPTAVPTRRFERVDAEAPTRASATLSIPSDMSSPDHTPHNSRPASTSAEQEVVLRKKHVKTPPVSDRHETEGREGRGRIAFNIPPAAEAGKGDKKKSGLRAKLSRFFSSKKSAAGKVYLPDPRASQLVPADMRDSFIIDPAVLMEAGVPAPANPSPEASPRLPLKPAIKSSRAALTAEQERIARRGEELLSAIDHIGRMDGRGAVRAEPDIVATSSHSRPESENGTTDDPTTTDPGTEDELDDGTINATVTQPPPAPVVATEPPAPQPTTATEPPAPVVATAPEPPPIVKAPGRTLDTDDQTNC